MRKCIDVCKHQGVIDWEKVKADGIDYCILRVLKRGGTDDCFERNYREAKAAGLKVGGYVYSYATSIEKAQDEANRCLKNLQGKTLDLPVFFDCEEPTVRPCGKEKITKFAALFMDVMKAAGFMTGIYANQEWHDKYIDWKALNYPDWWAARVGKNDDGVTIKIKPIGNYVAHQFTWKARVNGIKGDVDMSVLYKEYVPEFPKWVHNEEDKTWKYQLSENQFAKGWVKIAETGAPQNVHWYYFDSDGIMKTGWFEIGTDWYYAEPYGHGLAGALYRSDDKGIQSVWYL